MEPIRQVKTTYGTEAKHYDQIAWFRDDLTLRPSGHAGKVDFTGAVYQEFSLNQVTYRISDHFPLWVEFLTDRSTEAMATVHGVDPGNPDLFGDILG